MKQYSFRKLACVGASLGMILSMTACSSVRKGITTESSNIVNVEVVKPEITSIERNKDFVGRIVPDELIAVMPTMPDKVISINKNVGDYVKEGELLFEMDTQNLQQQVDLAKSGLEIAMIQANQATGSSVDMSVLQAELSYKAADLEYDNAKDNLDKLEDMEDEEIAAMGGDDIYDAQRDSLKAALDGAKTKLHYAKSEYDRAKGTTYNETKQINDASIQKAEAGYKSALDAMNETKVYSPVSGVVQQSNVDMYETPSMENPAMMIAGDNTMAVTIGIPEKYLGNINAGAEVKFKYGDQVYTGIISEVGIAANENTGLVDIKVSVADAEGVFAAGATITVNFVVESAKDVLVIPYKALHIENGEEYVFINNNGIAEKRLVKLGVVNNDYAEITEGLSAEDAVITTKSSSIGTGVKVEETQVDNAQVIEGTEKEEAEQ